MSRTWSEASASAGRGSRIDGTVEALARLNGRTAALGASRENAYRTDHLYLRVVESLVELRSEAVEVVVAVGECSVAVELFHDPPRPWCVPHTIVEYGAAEYDPARRKHRHAVVDDDALGRDCAGQAMQ